MNTTNTLDSILTLIAQKHMDIETLETRHGDSLDFHDVAVWRLKEALQAAFVAGCEAGLQMPKATESEIAEQH